MRMALAALLAVIFLRGAGTAGLTADSRNPS